MKSTGPKGSGNAQSVGPKKAKSKGKQKKAQVKGKQSKSNKPDDNFDDENVKKILDIPGRPPGGQKSGFQINLPAVVGLRKPPAAALAYGT